MHTLSASWHVIIILVHRAASCAVGAGLILTTAFGGVELEILHHCVGGGSVLGDTGRENLLEEFQVLKLATLGELDIELDIKVPVVVVAERGHTLATDDLDGVWW